MTEPSDSIASLPETAIEREMRIDKSNAHALKMKELETRQVEAKYRSDVRRKRAEATFYSIGAAVFGIVAIGIAWIIWQGTAGPSDEDQRYQEQYTQCVVDKGGTWIPGDAVHGPICVADGKATTK